MRNHQVLLTSEEPIVDMLKKLDWTEAESMVYLLLLKYGTVSAGELARVSAYSRPRVYDILRKLVELGLAKSYPGRPVKFRVLDPEIAIPSYIAVKRSELEKAENTMKNSLKEFYSRETCKEVGVFINRSLRMSAMKYCDLVRNAREEVHSFLGWVSKEEIESLINAYAIAEKNGVVTNIAYFQNKMFMYQIEEKDVRRLSTIVTNFTYVDPDKLPLKNPPMKFLSVDNHSINITLGDYLEDGTLKDVISVHYHNIPVISKMGKEIVPIYFKLLFGFENLQVMR